MTSGITDARASNDVKSNVEDILPLLPNQMALLLYRDLEPEDPGFLQVRFRVEGPLDIQRYEHAWQDVMAQHPALRMSVKVRDAGKPLAIVWKRAELPIEVEDWRDVEDVRGRILETLRSDRQAGIDLARAPAMRLGLYRTADEVYEAVWTCHHLNVDGWSAAVVLEDVMSSYRSGGTGNGTIQSSSSRALRSYVQWMSEQSQDDLRAYWTQSLAGYTGAHSIQARRAHTDAGHSDVTTEIPTSLSDRIIATASDLNVTSAVLLQAAWALTVSALVGSDDVVFGTTVSGRNAEIPGIERLVGYLSNAVPVRASIERSTGLPEWLARFRNNQFEMGQFEHASLADIHRWSDVPGHSPMFETFVVIENYPAGETGDDGVLQTGFTSGLTTAYPITLAVGMDSRWFFRLRYDMGSSGDELAKALIHQLTTVLEVMVERPHATVGAILDSAGDSISRHKQDTSGDAGRSAQSGRAAESATERRLATIWAQHLDLRDPVVDADYFDLGGSSLGAVRMFSAINDEFETDLPLSTLLTHSTIAELATILDAATSGVEFESTSLVAIQPHGARPPIAAVHGGQGEVLFYKGLSDELGPDQPLYGLQPVGLDGSTDPLNSVPEMAAAYIEELKVVQPEGPYRLIGFCFGGTVCLEMAAQLEAQGNEVDFIGIIDGGLPIEEARYDSMLQRATYMVRSRGVAGTASAAWRRASWRVSERFKSSDRKREGDEQLKYVPVALACSRAFNSFEPRPTAAPITLIRSAEQQPGEGKDWDFAWEEFTPELSTEHIDADHKRLFEGTPVRQLADVIQRSTES
ncbi:MAG: condensation domain-containing protein [Acidimicrobiia bacterium]